MANSPVGATSEPVWVLSECRAILPPVRAYIREPSDQTPFGPPFGSGQIHRFSRVYN
ncbi:UNVERIFIED_CONTAM: hypothetical protein ABIC26_004141 [Paenibacillus sp. PvR008]